MEMAFDFSTSDFATLVKTDPFIDNTLMIRDIFNESSRILITAPQHFGKSANMDMIKRFLEIEMDGSTPKAPNTTENYKLFKKNKLNIICDKQCMKNHFGQYPVIHMNFQPLGDVQNYDQMLQTIRTVIRNTFKQHKYLLQYRKRKQIYNSTDTFDKSRFQNYCSEKNVEPLSEMEITSSFSNLSRMLYAYFQKKVFVLIDNYDAFINNAYSRSKTCLFNNSDATQKEMMYLNDKIIATLLNNSHVERALLTGVLPIAGDHSFFHKNKIDCYYFMDGHRFCKYYGLSSDNLDIVLMKYIQDDVQRNKIKQMIDENYYGYVIGKQGVKVYNIWSTFQFLRRQEVQSYWCSVAYLKGSDLKEMFSNNKVQYNIERLLLGEEVKLKDALHPLSTTDVLQMNASILSGDINHEPEDVSSSIANMFLILLYHFGYLSIAKHLNWGYVSVTIPNDEIKCELAKIILQTNKRFHCISEDAIGTVRLAIDLFQPNCSEEDSSLFENFWLAIENLCQQVTVNGDFLTLHLLVILLTRQEYNKTVACRASSNGPVIIYIKNKHHVDIYVTAQQDTSQCSTMYTLRKSAINAHDQLVSCDHGAEISSHSFKLLIGIGYGRFNTKGEDKCSISIAYTSYNNNHMTKIEIIPNIEPFSSDYMQ